MAQTQEQTQVQTTKAPRVHRVSKGKKTQVQTEAVAHESTVESAPAPAATLGYFVNIGRPTAGARLFAHTAAFLALSGMADGKAYPRAKATQVIGPVAVKYHMGNGNIEATEDGLILSERGKAEFGKRKTDPEMLKAYTGILSTGKADGSIVKSDSHIKAIS